MSLFADKSPIRTFLKRPRPEGAIELNLAPPLIKRGTFCQLDISGAILYCLTAILGMADQLCVS